jgi:hypothetical protein
MARTLFLLMLAGAVVVGLFGCGGSSSTGFGNVEAFISGRYDVLSKDPGVLPNFSSIQLFQSGKSLEGIDNLGRTWTGTLSNFTKSGVYEAGAQQQQQQQTPTQPGQQQQEVPESFAAEIYLKTQTRGGTIALTGVVESRGSLSIPTTGNGTGQTTTSTYVTIYATAIDEGGNAGSITLYNPAQVDTGATTTP